MLRGSLCHNLDHKGARNRSRSRGCKLDASVMPYAGELNGYVVDELNVRSVVTCSQPAQYSTVRAVPQWQVRSRVASMDVLMSTDHPGSHYTHTTLQGARRL